MKISKLVQWICERRFQMVSDEDQVKTFIRSEDQVKIALGKKVISIVTHLEGFGGGALLNCPHPDTTNDMKNLFKALNIPL